MNLSDYIKIKATKYTELEEYVRIIDIINTNKVLEPDVSIEACKSLMEGLCKFILSKLDDNFLLSEVNAMSFT